MIELITGAPGAGKTTYAVAKRLAVEAGKKIKTEDGAEVERRLVCAGFRGLVVPHERLPHKLTGETTSTADVAKWNALKPDLEDAPVHERLPGEPAQDVPAIVENWWLWCKPGDLIAIDEAQFVAPRGTMGRKPPLWIQKLEVHRHYGVDFLIVTQHPQLIDTTIRALVGLHRHVRAVMGSPVCMVYVWDYASNPERYTMANKTQFVRRRKHYALFHSSVAHVKPPSSGRWAVVVVPLLALVGFGGLAAKITGMVDKPKVEAKAGGPAPPRPRAPAHALVAPPAASTRPAGFVDVPKLQGCWAQGERCECIGVDGRPVPVVLSMCRTSASSFGGLVQWEPRKFPDVEKLPESAPSSGAAPSARLVGGAPS